MLELSAPNAPYELELPYGLKVIVKPLTTAGMAAAQATARRAVEGPGGVQASFDFRGAKNDAAGRMVTVTLTNDLDGTIYG